MIFNFVVDPSQSEGWRLIAVNAKYINRDQFFIVIKKINRKKIWDTIYFS